MRFGLSLVLVGGAVCFLNGCSRSKPDESVLPPATNPPAQVRAWQPPGFAAPQGSNPVAPGDTNSSMANPTPPNTDTAQQMATLQKRYSAAQGFDDRFEVAGQIGETANAEAVAALEQLFRQEPDKDLRVELINAMIGITCCKDERLRFLTQGLSPDQPTEVREAAIDGLVDLEDARALTLLQGLFKDPDEKIRELAQHSHSLVQEMVKNR